MNLKRYSKNTHLIIYALLVMLILVPLISESLNRFSYVPEGASQSTLLSTYELSAVSNCLSKYGQDVRLISDPFTMVYLSSYINHIAIASSSMPPFSVEDNNILTAIWQNLFHGNSSSNIYSNISSLDSVTPFSEQLYLQRNPQQLNLSNYLIIVSGRTSYWLDQGDPFGYYPLFPQEYNVSFSQIARFYDPQYFTLVYSIPDKVYVFSSGLTNTTVSPVADGNVLSLSLAKNGAVIDNSPYANDVTAYGNLAKSSVDGVLSFDGVGSYLEVADSSCFHDSSFSVEFSFCPTVDKPWVAVYKGSFSADGSWYVYGDNAHMLVARFWFDGCAYDVSYSYDFLGKWSDVVVVFPSAGQSIELYVDGLLVASGAKMPVGASFNTEKLWVGRYEVSSYYFSGFMDGVRVYDQALSQLEIYHNYLYQSQRTATMPVGDNTIILSYYELSALDYLMKNSDDNNVPIISDPFTMSYFNSYLNHTGLMVNLTPPFNSDSTGILTNLWNGVFKEKSSINVYSNVTGLNTQKAIIVISGRTAWWLDQADPYGYYPLFPKNYSASFSHITQFCDTRYFTLSYEIPQKIYIFTVENTNSTLSPTENGKVLDLTVDPLSSHTVIDKSTFANTFASHSVTVDGVLSFDGVGSYLEVADSSCFHDSSFSVEFSFCPTVDKPWVAVYKGSFSADGSWYVYGDNAHMLVARFWFDGCAYDVSYSYDFLGKWSDVVVVFPSAGQSIELYVDGLLVASGAKMPVGASFNTEKLWVGRYEVPDYYFSGFIDTVRVYNRPLTQLEIYRNYLCESQNSYLML